MVDRVEWEVWAAWVEWIFRLDWRQSVEAIGGRSMNGGLFRESNPIHRNDAVGRKNTSTATAIKKNIFDKIEEKSGTSTSF